MNYGQAIRSALLHSMEQDSSIFIMGIGVDDHKAVFGTTAGLVGRFGRNRVFDTPISESGMTGIAIGAALAGMKPIHIHIRSDFLYLAMDQIANIAAKWSSMFGGNASVPLVIRSIVGRSWGQGAQHSQSLQSLFMHIPGLKVLMPTTPSEAQGLLIAAIQDPNPVLIFEHRLLYDIIGDVPDTPTALPLGRAIIRRKGSDMTLVAGSYMAVESLKAAEFLSKHGVEAEIVDPVSLVPLDENRILASVAKTGRVIVIDSSWTTCGMSAEIAALIVEKGFHFLKAPIRRLGMQPVVCPVSKPLEAAFYPNAKLIAAEALTMLGRDFPKTPAPELLNTFKGPF